MFCTVTERTWFDCISLLVMPCITIMWQIKKPWPWPWLYPGLKDCVSFRTFVFLAVYALYRELIIVIYRAFTFRFVLSNKNRTSNSLMQLCSFLKRAFILTVLDCCLELGAIPVSCSCERCASRPVSDYIPFYMRVIESAQFSNVFTFHYLGIISM